MTESALVQPPNNNNSIIATIGSLLIAGRWSSVEKARLSRYSREYRNPGEFIALRLLAAAGCPVADLSIEQLKNWFWLVHCMAIVSRSGRDPHSISFESGFGRVLFMAGVSEFRMRYLLEARGERFQDLLGRASHQIAKLGEPVNWSRLAPILLASDPEGGSAERARIEIARDFALAAANTKEVVLRDAL